MGACVRRLAISEGDMLPLVAEEVSPVASSSSLSFLAPDIFTPTSSLPTLPPLTEDDIETMGMTRVQVLRNADIWGRDPDH